MTVCMQCNELLDGQAHFCASCGAPAGTTSVKPDHESAVRALMERRNDGILVNLGKEFRTLRWSAVVPLSHWWRDKSWKLVWVKWLFFFALAPLALSVFFARDGVSLELAVSAIGLYFAVLWSFVFQLCLLPEPVGRRIAFKVIGFTLFFGGGLWLLAHAVPWIESIYEQRNSDRMWTRLFAYTIGVGLVEESVKAFAIYWLAYRRRLALRPVTYSYLGALSGLAFGVAEAVDYSMRYMSKHLVDLTNSLGGATSAEVNARIEHAYGDYLLVEFLRIITLPLLHAVMTGITCLFIGVAVQHRHARHALVLVGLSIATMFHGAYDALEGWYALAVAASLLAVYIAYLRSADRLSHDAAWPAPATNGASTTMTPALNGATAR